MSAPRIACCAIVKNEEEVLERMINSVKFMVDKFIIFDTGSTDSTKEIIKKYGELYETPFTDYVETKNKVLEFVDTLDDIDYILWMDADEILEVFPERLLEAIKENRMMDFFETDITDAHEDVLTISYTRKRVWKNHNYQHGWKFCGPGIHEYMHIPDGKGYIDRTVKVFHKHKTKNKDFKANYLFYLDILSNAVQKNPNDLRGWFYLSRTYKDLGRYKEAIKTYKHYLRTAKENNYNWIDELWQAKYDIAICYELLGDIDAAIKNYEDASRFDERRAEGLFALARIHFYDKNHQDYKKSKKYLLSILEKEIPYDVPLFLDPRYYREMPLDLLPVVAWELQDYDLGLKALDIILKFNLPEEERKRITNNKHFYLKKLKEMKKINIIHIPFATIDNYFAKIFVINLRHRPDRLEKTKERLKLAGINNYEIFNAYNGEILGPLTDANIPVRRTGGYLGCLLSHLDIIWQAKKNGWPNVLILEDDIKIYNQIIPAFNKIAQDLENYHPDWDIFYPGHASFDGYYDFNKDSEMIYTPTIKKFEHSVVPATQAWALHSYAIRDKFYDTILNYYNQGFYLEIDRWLLDQIQNKNRDKYKVVVAYPQLFIQEENFSDNFKGMGTNHDKYINTEYSTAEEYF